MENFLHDYKTLQKKKKQKKPFTLLKGTVNIRRPHFLRCAGIRRSRSSEDAPDSSTRNSSLIRNNNNNNRPISQSKTSRTSRRVCLPWGVKSNRGGRGRPFGKEAFGSFRLSKKGWAHASNWKMCNTIRYKQRDRLRCQNH